MIYGYCRVSTRTQNIDRQISNIRNSYPEAIIFVEDGISGRTFKRPEWEKLYRKLKPGDTVVFDDVSRMSRNANEGFKLYEELYYKDIELVFLAQPQVNTSVYRDARKKQLEVDLHSGSEPIDRFGNGMFQLVNKLLWDLAEEQIRLSFDKAEDYVVHNSRRTKGGLEEAKRRGKRLGQKPGNKLKIKKEKPIKDLIRKYSRDFEGSNTDSEVMGILATKTITITDEWGKERAVPAKLARNTYYKYKAEMLSLESDLRNLNKAIESDMDEDMIP